MASESGWGWCYLFSDATLDLWLSDHQELEARQLSSLAGHRRSSGHNGTIQALDIVSSPGAVGFEDAAKLDPSGTGVWGVPKAMPSL